MAEIARVAPAVRLKVPFKRCLGNEYSSKKQEQVSIADNCPVHFGVQTTFLETAL